MMRGPPVGVEKAVAQNGRRNKLWLPARRTEQRIQREGWERPRVRRTRGTSHRGCVRGTFQGGSAGINFSVSIFFFEILATFVNL